MTWSVIKQRLLVTCKGRGPCDNSERLAEPAVGGGAGVGGDRGPAQGGVEGEGLGQGGVGVEDEAGHAEAAGGGFQVGHQRAGGAPATGGGGDPEAFDLARRGIVAAEGAAADGVIRETIARAYIERYNRTVRHEWLDQYIIETIEEAQDHATQWLWTYTNDRPNMGIGGITPAQKLKMAASVLQMHPLKNGGITKRDRNETTVQR